MSSEGTVRNSAGDTVKMELMDILRGDYIADHVSIWYYRLDDIEGSSRSKHVAKSFQTSLSEQKATIFDQLIIASFFNNRSTIPNT